MLLERSWRLGAAFDDELTILQWNCLADWASHAFPKVRPEWLSWDYRFPRIVAECLRADPDIICLQEVDRYEDLISVFSESYDGTFTPKRSSDSTGRDGCAVFWKRQRLNAVDCAAFEFWRLCDNHRMKQIFLAPQFGLNTSGGIASLRVVTTHLKAKPDFDEFRTSQCQALAEYLNAESPPLDLTVVCGDFNTQEDSKAIEQLIKNTRSMPLRSAYRSIDLNGADAATEPAWTTWKIREKVKKQTIDFVFFDQSSDWKPVDVWGIPANAGVDPEVGLPNQQYPSDHLALAAKFRMS